MVTYAEGKRRWGGKSGLDSNYPPPPRLRINSVGLFLCRGNTLTLAWLFRRNILSIPHSCSKREYWGPDPVVSPGGNSSPILFS